MTTYRAAIVGLGPWLAAGMPDPASDPVLGTAAPHSHAAAMSAIPSIELVAGCDITEVRRQEFVGAWGDRWPGLRLYDDVGEMLRREQLDIICVATPDNRHADIVLAAVEAGVRAIFCEKPLATSLQDADRMIEAVNRAGVVMTVDHTLRWLPEFVEARRLLRDGAVGPLTHVIVEWSGARAMLWRNHSHALDLLSYFVDAEPDWVVAELESGFEDYGIVYRGNGGRDATLEPGSNAYLAFKNGVRAYFSGTKRAAPGRSVQLVGERGRIVLDPEGARLLTWADEAWTVRQLEPRFTVSGVQAAFLDLIDSLEHDHPTWSPPQSARMTVAIIDAILRSQAQGNQPVRVHLDGVGEREAPAARPA
jgi:predicted dehydrogenase